MEKEKPVPAVKFSDVLIALILGTIFAIVGVHYFGNTADRKLMHAVQNSDAPAVRTALEEGANPNTYIWPDRPLLIEAVETENAIVVDYLLLWGANVDVSTSRDPGKTPLFSAVFRNNLLITRMLLEAGADANMIVNPESGLTLIMVAVQQKEIGFHKDIRILKLLLRHGGNATAKDAEGKTAMMIAREHKNTEAISVLKDHLGIK